ncbi:4Fe-4S dicluster domain-containing protein [Methanobrevibacter sp. OttesenSCG-928-K11]|nr:4Fe-4S dicluster domain-containing protein [Methanobrevibacter sp. OttesenSCG-928-K11]MDL2270893.1 4Fe-4S dicluster domain-containing protein [Methanobrevibacter sp. OttesenSCG-928-I08]
MEKILVQRELCDGCLDCEHACNSIHNTSRIKILEYDSSYYPIICQQCEDAPCEKICPTEAMGSTKVDSDKCISCGLCSMVCPFGAINLVEKTAEKCDQCIDREEGPACIKACSKRAISKVDLEKLKADKQEKYVAKLSGKPTKPGKNSVISIITGRNKS